jgi:hypothetical protein
VTFHLLPLPVPSSSNYAPVRNKDEKDNAKVVPKVIHQGAKEKERTRARDKVQVLRQGA